MRQIESLEQSFLSRWLQWKSLLLRMFYFSDSRKTMIELTVLVRDFITAERIFGQLKTHKSY